MAFGRVSFVGLAAIVLAAFVLLALSPIILIGSLASRWFELYYAGPRRRRIQDARLIDRGLL